MADASPFAAVAATFARSGVAIVEHALTEDDLAELARLFGGHAGRRHHDLPAEQVAWIARHPVLSALAGAVSGTNARPVRVVAFDKTPTANWLVPWHQDRTIALAARSDVAGFSHWTTKDGHIHAEPPVSFLEGMATLRVHLDDCDESAGPLEVLPGTHALGRLDRAAIADAMTRHQPRLCLAARGDILVMRPLLVHRSQRARVPGRRRVLHIEYAARDLPHGLAWALAAAPSYEDLH
jgi:ectoine hydroxylase-related dioxygenase (phytanoyl-CoA dioxygenase family)